eukprot:TRINITY_DN2276_c0_g1_i1.p1 TRINITY_DN2276_c0_g1~~TRINITY_DN2276_c0_g1_i1.p1  ORF type:complete len:943 (+),score=115.31 TRINITY_DN2276_c0_g1_i1:87-2915(+)
MKSIWVAVLLVSFSFVSAEECTESVTYEASHSPNNVLFVKVQSSLSSSDFVLWERTRGANIEISSTISETQKGTVLSSFSFANRTLNIDLNFQPSTNEEDGNVDDDISQSSRNLVLLSLLVASSALACVKWNAKSIVIIGALSVLVAMVSSQITECSSSASVTIVKFPEHILTTCHNGRCIQHSRTTMGGQLHFYMYNYTEEESKMLKDVFSIVRCDMTWSLVEKNTRKNFNYSYYEGYVNAIQTNVSADNVFVMAYDNALYTDRRAIYTQDARDGYSDYVMHAMEGFKGKNVVWELWNEPDLAGFWHPVQNVTEYGMMALQAGRAARQNYPNETLAGPGYASVADLAFLEGLLKMGMQNYFHLWTIHPYRGTGYPEDAINVFIHWRRMLKAYSAPTDIMPPIASGEWGYSQLWVNESMQAAFFVREFLTNVVVESSYTMWYDWRDDGTNATYFEHHFGIVEYAWLGGEQPLKPKPAYNAAKVLKRVLQDYTFNKQISLDTTDSSDRAQKDFLVLFDNIEGDGSKILVAWTTLTVPSRTATFHVGIANQNLTAISMYGDTWTMTTNSEGDLTVGLSFQPVYILLPSEVIADSSYLQIVAASPRLPFSTWYDNMIDNFLDVVVCNPTASTTTVRLLGLDGNSSISADRCATLQMPLITPATAFVKTFVTVEIEGMGSYSMHTFLSRTSLFDIEVSAFSSSGAQISERPLIYPQVTAVFNLSTSTITKELNFADASSSTSVNITLPDGKSKPTLQILAASTDETVGKYQLEYHLLSSPTPNAVFYDLGNSNMTYWPRLNWTSVQSTSGNPLLGLEIYRFTIEAKAGARYVCANTQPDFLIDVNPITKFHMYFKGDASNGRVSLRIRDASGQIFQPSSLLIDFVGWKLLTFEIDGAIFWGGSGPNYKQGVVFYPIYLRAYITFDLPNGGPYNGTLEFSQLLAVSK